jgi:predicted lipoprotein
MKKIRYSYVLFLSIIIFACKKSNTNPADKFDRAKMLENYAQNLIKPAYQDLQNSVNSLQVATTNFTQNPTLQNLSSLQVAWTNAYTLWQYANAYNFGVAGEQGLRKGLIEEIGTFPVSTEKIETAINTNTFNFNDFNRDARGFLALEYLIFDLNENQNNIVTAFANQSRKDYLLGVANHLKTRVDEVVNGWNASYYNEFMGNVGTDVGSSTSLLYNEFIKSFESIKNFKLGLPLGKRPGQVQTEPQLVEAYYSGQSLAMLKEHLIAIENIWYGKAKNGTDGIGFKEYLESVEGGNALVQSTENQLQVVKNTLNAIPSSPRLSSQITTNATPLETLYTELQRHTRFFKSDMSSLLGISITFSSGDGD